MMFQSEMFKLEALDCFMIFIIDATLRFVSLQVLKKQNLIKKMDGCNEGGATHDQEKRDMAAC